MIPTLAPNLLPPQPATSEPLLARLLPAGGQLAATVMQAGSDSSGARLQIRLHMAGQLLELNTRQPVPAGSQVILSRSVTGQLQLSLATNTPTAPPRATTLAAGAQTFAPTALETQTPRPMQSTAPASALSNTATNAALDSALRTSLPRQQSLGAVLNQLTQQLEPGTATAANRQLSPLIQSLLQMFGIAPGQRDSAPAVQRNIEKGGFFTEARLSQGAAPPGHPKASAGPDLKAQMGQLQQLADALPPQAREQMNKLLGDLLARITKAQISSARQNMDLPDGTSVRHLALDLPVRLGERMENAELTIMRHRARSGEDPASSYWRVRLTFDLQELGPLEAELRLRDDSHMSASFWAPEPDTARLIEQRLQGFADHLARQGIHVDELDCHQGSAPRSDTSVQRQLINIKT